jgi:hypothetical protein
MTVLVQITVRATPRTEQLQDLAQTGPGRLETRSASQPGSRSRHERVAARHRLSGWWSVGGRRVGLVVVLNLRR